MFSIISQFVGFAIGISLLAEIVKRVYSSTGSRVKAILTAIAVGIFLSPRGVHRNDETLQTWVIIALPR
jgi:hypothetical protein